MQHLLKLMNAENIQIEKEGGGKKEYMPHPRQTFTVRKPAEKFLKALSHEMDLAFEDMHGHSIGMRQSL